MEGGDTMKALRKLGGLLAIGSIGAWIASVLKSKLGGEVARGPTMLLGDENAEAAPYSLVVPREQPVFEVDDLKRPYALLEDQETREMADRGHRVPFELEEAAGDTAD